MIHFSLLLNFTYAILENIMNKVNYQKELEKIIASLENPQKVFLHSCCAPCSSYCMEYLRKYFEVTVFYYNPNIMQEEEYRKRVAELKRLIEVYNKIEVIDDIANKQQGALQTTAYYETLYPIRLVEGNYDVNRYLDTIKGLEACKEGGSRCEQCFSLRLRETAKVAKEMGMDYFTTTLTISPLKNAQLINQLGETIGKEEGIAWLPSDFKKNNGYLRSIELSKEYDLYRQDYCGCDFSKKESSNIE